MPEVQGNIEGIRKSVLDELEQLYDVQVEPDCFIPQEIVNGLCNYSAALNREIAVYITRYGEIVNVIIGKSDHINLPDLSLRRSKNRLSMIRCIHTHPSATGMLSEVDISALNSMKFDAMCAIGVKEDGTPTSAQCAFIDPATPGTPIRTDIIYARRIPQEAWMQQIEDTDAAYIAILAETDTKTEKAVLVGIESESSLDELQELAKTAGAQTILRVLQKRAKPDSAFCIGRGKAEELCLQCQAIEADLVIFDEVLTGAMQKNLEETIGLKVIDRTALILDIFAARASTREGKLQVEMAQLQYRSQRLLGQGLIMSRLAGGIGTRGPGESKLEVNRRRIRDRLTELGRELAQIEKQRGLRRQNREKNGIPVIALVGYTNAGKSTLFNKLTGADVYVQDQLFATLDSVSRPIVLPHGGKALLVDTVGFIRKLPHEVVKAFRATLEQAKLADVLVIVSDGVDNEMEKRHETVEEVLDSLEAKSAPRIDALNKCDLLDISEDRMPGAIRISAATGYNLEALLEEVEKKLNSGMKEVSFLIPFDKYFLVNKLRTLGTVVNEEYVDNGVQVKALVEDVSIEYVCREGAKVIGDYAKVLQNEEKNDTII